jgi:cyclophilin family peptidyl-prolyl cis-trans isomerase
MKITLLLPISLAFALPALAQEGAQKAPAGQQPATKAPAAQGKPEKDSQLTAKDPAIVAIDEFIKKSGPAKKEGNWKSSLAQPPKVTFNKEVNYEWHIKTNKGDITVKLLPDVAPMHVSSTIYLSRLGFYDGVKFHRVIEGFMAQGGDPTGTGSGGPGYSYEGEFDAKVKHDHAGMLSMANTGRPKTDGSQFFLTFAPTHWLDGKHSIFGEVTNGMETLKALEACHGPKDSGVPPSEDLVMEQTWIVVTPGNPIPKDAPKEAPGAVPQQPGKKGG